MLNIMKMIFSMMIAAGTVYCQVGEWRNVTPADCSPSGFGVSFVALDPVRPSDVYFHCNQQGMWKSTDYGLTWKKTNTGINAAQAGSGAAWGAEIDHNPSRDPSTPPTIYMTSGYGALGLWKSTNGGVDWAQIWNNNIYDPDGTTNISCDVGSDMLWVVLPDPTDINYVVTCLHSYRNGYSGCGNVNHNGLFVSRDGGGKWIFRPCPFTFAAHSDVLRALDKKTWIVCHNPAGFGDPTQVWRSTDEGVTWVKVADLTVSGIRLCTVGNTIYANGLNGLFKTSDNGATWSVVPGTRTTSSVVASATTLYTSKMINLPDRDLRHASLSNVNVWIDDPSPPDMSGGYDAEMMFDGTHYIIISGGEGSGVWRYVEPASSTGIGRTSLNEKPSNSINLNNKAQIRMNYKTARNQSRNVFGITGQRINPSASSRQAIIIRSRLD